MSQVIKTTSKPYGIPEGERTIRELLSEIHECIKDMCQGCTNDSSQSVVAIDQVKFYLNLENIDGLTDEIEKKLGFE